MVKVMTSFSLVIISKIMWWCVTLSAQSKVRPHSFFSNCDGVWPSRLSTRSNLTLFSPRDSSWPSRLSPRSWPHFYLLARNGSWPSHLSTRSDLTFTFRHVTVRNPLDSVQGLDVTFPLPVLQKMTSLLGNDPNAWNPEQN